MITREEYEASMKKIRTIKGAITPMSNYIDSLEQHIKELKSQLSGKPEQLTCENCKYFSWDGRGIGQCHNCSPQCPRYTLTNFGCIFHTKEPK